MGGLDIPSFIPRIRQYFGQFSPTVQSLTLREPIGSDRQIVFFIGLFSRLEDLKLYGRPYCSSKVLRGGLAPTPISAPPFGGRLSMIRGGHGLAKTMIDQFGGFVSVT